MTFCSYSFERKNTGTSFKIIYNFCFKVDSIALSPDLDPNWAKILDPDPNSIHLDPQHWLKVAHLADFWT